MLSLEKIYQAKEVLKDDLDKKPEWHDAFDYYKSLDKKDAA